MTYIPGLQEFVEGKNEVTTKQCAEYLGLNPLNYGTALARALRKLGWKNYRVKRGGISGYAYQKRPTVEPEIAGLDTAETRAKALRKYLRDQRIVMLDQCCFALRIVPGPEVLQEVAANLKRWRWVRLPIHKGRLEWVRRSDEASHRRD